MDPPNDEAGAFDGDQFSDWNKRTGAGDGVNRTAKDSEIHMEQSSHQDNYGLPSSRGNTGGGGEIGKTLDNVDVLREDTELATTGRKFSYSSIYPPSVQQQGAGYTSYGDTSIISKPAELSTGYFHAHRESAIPGFLAASSSFYPGLVTSTQISGPNGVFLQPTAYSPQMNQPQVFNGVEYAFETLGEKEMRFLSNHSQSIGLTAPTTSGHLQDPVLSNSFVSPLDPGSWNIFGPNYLDIQPIMHGLPPYTSLEFRSFPPNVQLVDQSFRGDEALEDHPTQSLAVSASYSVPSTPRHPPPLWSGSSSQTCPSRKTPAQTSARSSSNGRSRPPTTLTPTKVTKRSSGVKLGTPRTPRPKRPGNRKLLAHELRLLMRLYLIVKPSTPLLSTNEELEKWFDSWATASYNEDLYKSWARFQNEHSTAVEKDLSEVSIVGDFDTIPLTDVADIFSPEISERKKAATQLYDEKMEVYINNTPHYRGFTPLGGTGSPGPDGQGNINEAFDWGHKRKLNDDPDDKFVDPYMRGKNIWPRQLPNFEAVLLDYYKRMRAFGRIPARNVALSPGLDELYFAPVLTHPGCSALVTHYPPQEVGPKKFGLDGHTDSESNRDVRALEVLNKNGYWVSAPPRKGCCIVNVGNQLQT